MDPRFLEFFLRVAEFRSINRAALDLNLSQPALSRHIAALERDLGAKLLHRSTTGVHLTEAGAQLAQRARPVLRQLALLGDEIGQHAASQVCLGMPPAWQKLITGPLVKRIALERPEFALRVYEGINNVLRDYMAAGLVDLGIVACGVPAVAKFSRVPLVREPMLLVGDTGAGLDPGIPVALSRLRHTRLVLPGRPNIVRQQIEHVLKRHGHPFKIAVEAETLTLCLELARQGVGYTVMPYCALHDHPYAASMSWAPIRKLELTWALVENEARLHSSAVRDTRRLLVDEVEQRLASGAWPGAARPSL